MGSPARVIDRIDLRHTPEALERRFAGVPSAAMLDELLPELAGEVALVSSFGAEAAVLLHLVASIDPATPVLFTDTGHHFPETLAYRDQLATQLGLTDVRTIHPDPLRLAARDPAGERHGYDPDGCCDLRKVEPLARALTGFTAWISGRKAFQAATRAALPRFEEDAGRLKINALADWTAADLATYARAHALPPHPLVAQGYPSIGCAPCTTPVSPGEDARAGRRRATGKVECGIHHSTLG